jgi:hypothetical protein
MLLFSKKLVNVNKVRFKSCLNIHLFVNGWSTDKKITLPLYPVLCVGSDVLCFDVLLSFVLNANEAELTTWVIAHIILIVWTWCIHRTCIIT